MPPSVMLYQLPHQRATSPSAMVRNSVSAIPSLSLASAATFFLANITRGGKVSFVDPGKPGQLRRDVRPASCNTCCYGSLSRNHYERRVMRKRPWWARVPASIASVVTLLSIGFAHPTPSAAATAATSTSSAPSGATLVAFVTPASKATPKAVWVSEAQLNVRARPSTTGNVPRYTLNYGTKIMVTAAVHGQDPYRTGQSKWYVLSSGGYVWAGGVTIVSPSRGSPATLTSASVPTGTLTCAGLERLWEDAGGNPAHAFMAAEIAMAESGGQQYALSPTNDYGYWQINSAHGALATFNALGNARSAIILSHNGANWSPWTTYTLRLYVGRCRS